jgi:sugar lactone lactonase YvrE
MGAAWDPETPGNRGNDGACDAKGRFWFGTMMNNIGPLGEDLPITAPTGKLYRVDADGKASVMETRLACRTAPAGRPITAHSISRIPWRRMIWAYDFDLDSGTISNKPRAERQQGLRLSGRRNGRCAGLHLERTLGGFMRAPH